MRFHIWQYLIIAGVFLTQTLGYAAKAATAGDLEDDVIKALNQAREKKFSKLSSSAVLDAYEKLLRHHGVAYQRSWSTSEKAEVIEILPGSSNTELDRFARKLKNASKGRLFYCPACLSDQIGTFTAGKDIYIGHSSAVRNQVDGTLFHGFKSSTITRQIEEGKGPILGIRIEAKDGLSLTVNENSIYSKVLDAKDMAGYGVEIQSYISDSKAAQLGKNTGGVATVRGNLSQIREVAKRAYELSHGLTTQLFHFQALINKKKPWAFQYSKEMPVGSPAALHFATFDSEYGKLKIPLSGAELKLYEAGKKSKLQEILIKKLVRLNEGAQANTRTFDDMVKDIKSYPKINDPIVKSAPAKVQAVRSQEVKDKTKVTLAALESEIGNRRLRVEEFKFIEQEAAKLGVRAWLFGGTAAGYAHYVKWDMQREKGDARFQKDRFDYDYTNIYRSTQDLDIVIDGDAEQAQALQNALAAKYPHLQGSKTAWEVRLLTRDMGDKQAILNNPDFMNQHTDSNSTGMIEITKPKNGEHIVRDVRDWNSKAPHFLKDVHDGTLHYYFSALHPTTKFAKDGRNPPILSAIRYLTKAFQYELELRPEDLDQIKKVINEFDPKLVATQSYVSHWIEKNGKKLMQNAVNIEYAWDTLEKLGLRKKLQEIKNDVNTNESLAWWMNKEPLRTKPIGQGSGMTAKELGLDTVAHETKSFLAYESITRAHTGDPNVFISRDGAPGEAAAFGDGFYTKAGREGSVGTGLTIRFKLDPNAREGADFHRANQGNYLVVTNKAALRVIPESLNVGPVEYFKLLAQNEFNASDGGILEKMRRRIGAKIQTLSTDDLQGILKIVSNEVQREEVNSSAVLKEWFAMPVSRKHPEFLHKLINKSSDFNRALVEHALSQPHWVDYGDLVSPVEYFKLLAQNKLKFGNDAILENMRRRVGAKFQTVSAGELQEVLKIISHELQDVLMAGWDPNKLNRKLTHSTILKEWFAMPVSREHPDYFWKLADLGAKSDDYLIEHVLSHPHWADYGNLVSKFLWRNDFRINYSIIKYVLSKPHAAAHPEWIEQLIKEGDDRLLDRLAEHVFSQPHTASHPELLVELIQRSHSSDVLKKYVLNQPHWQSHPQLISSLIKSGRMDNTLAFEFMSNPEWDKHPEWIEELLQKGTADKAIAFSFLTEPRGQDHPEWLETIIKRPYGMNDHALNHVLDQPRWKEDPELRRLAGGKDPTAKSLREAFERGETWRKSGLASAKCITKNLSEKLM